MEDGLMGALVTREEVNCARGAGLWRSILRFALTRTSDKLASLGGQNDAAEASEPHHTCSSLIMAAVARELRNCGGRTAVWCLCCRGTKAAMVCFQ